MAGDPGSGSSSDPFSSFGGGGDPTFNSSGGFSTSGSSAASATPGGEWAFNDPTAGINPSSFTGTGTSSGTDPSSGGGISQTGALNSASTINGIPAISAQGGGPSYAGNESVFSNPSFTYGTGVGPTSGGGTDPTSGLNASQFSNTSLSQPGPTAFNTALATPSGGAFGSGTSAFSAPSGVAPPDISALDPTTVAANQGGGATPFNTYGLPTGAASTPSTSTAPTAPTGTGTQTAGNTGLPTFSPDGTLQGNLTSNQGQTPAATPSTVASPSGAPSGTNFAALNTPIVGNITGNQSVTPTVPGSNAPATNAGGNSGGLFGSGINVGTAGGIAGVATAGAGLLNSYLNKNNVPGQQEVNAINSALSTLQSQTGPLSAEGQQLMSYLSNGQLPPAIQAQIDQATSAAKAQAASEMAARGLPTDPTSNQQLAQQYATIDQQSLVSAGQLQEQLYSAGMSSVQTALNSTGLSLQTYLGLQQIYQNQSNQEQSAISNLAQALGKMGGGGNNTLTIKTS